jgi:hypothetical protein
LAAALRCVAGRSRELRKWLLLRDLLLQLRMLRKRKLRMLRL